MVYVKDVARAALLSIENPKAENQTLELLRFQAVQKIYEQTVGTEHFLYTSCLNNLGLLYQDMVE